MTTTLKVLSYFTWFVIFSIACQAFPQSQVLAPKKDPIEKTPSDVFLEFVTKNLRSVDKKDIDYINNDWVVDLENHVQEWNVLEANQFLIFLQRSKISTEIILKILQLTDCLRLIRASLHFEPPKSQERSGSHLVLDFLDEKIDMDGIEKIMGEEYLDKADSIFSSWSVADAEILLNTLQNKFPIYNVMITLRTITNYLHAFKNNEINIALEKMENPVQPPKTDRINGKIAPETQIKVNQANEVIQLKPQALQPEVNQINEDVSEPQVESSQEIILESQAQNTEVTIQEVISENATGSDVFINYVKEYFRKEFEQNRTPDQTLDDYLTEQMFPLRSGSPAKSWQERIEDSAKSWTARDALSFLDILEKDLEIKPAHIIRVLQAPSFFIKTPYNSFKKRLDIYREHLTKTEIKTVIENSRLTFLKNGNEESIREYITFFIEYIGEFFFKELLNNSTILINTSRMVEELEQKRDYLEKYFGEGDRLKGREKLKKILSKKGGINAFKYFNVRYNEETKKWHNGHIDFLENTFNLAKSEVIRLIENNFEAFSFGLDNLSQSYAYLVDYLGAGDKVKGKKILERIIVVKRHFYGFSRFKVIWNKKTQQWENTYVNFLEKELGISKSKVREFIEKNIDSFSRGHHLSDIYKYLIDYLGYSNKLEGKRLLKEIIESNEIFHGFVNFKINKDQKNQKLQNIHINFLETKFKFDKPEIIELMKNNLLAFSTGNLPQMNESYTHLVAYLGGGNYGHNKLKKIINKNFDGFVNFKVSKENIHITLLEEKLGFKRTEVIEMMENNLQHFFISKFSELNRSYAYLVDYLGEGYKAEGRKLLKEIIATRGGLPGFVNFRVNAKGQNTVVHFLKETMHLNQREIIELLTKTKLQAFSATDFDELNQSYIYLTHYLGEGDLTRGRRKLERIIKKQGGLKTFVKFRLISINSKEKNEVVDFLEQVMNLSQKEIIRLMERHFLDFFSFQLTEANSEDFVDKLMEKYGEYIPCQEHLLAHSVNLSS